MAVVTALDEVIREINSEPRPVDALAPWRDRAACHGMGALFDSADPKDQRTAKDICWGCPVLVACHGWVRSLPERDDPGGVCGALTEAERTKRRRKQAPAKQPASVTSMPKQCRICQHFKQPSDFYRNSDSPDGLRNECTDCYRGGRTEKKKQGAL